MYQLWRDIASFRQQYTELKGITERDLTRVKNDLAQTSRSLTSACLSFLTVETQGQVNWQNICKYFFHVCFLKATAERERVDRATFESQIREKTREIADLQQK
jgi:hypothetical protein